MNDLDRWCNKVEKYEGELKAEDVKELLKLLRKNERPTKTSNKG